VSNHLGKEGMFERSIVLGDRSILFEGREYLEVWDLRMLLHIVHLFLLGCSGMGIITAFVKLPGGVYVIQGYFVATVCVMGDLEYGGNF
jgi:hypothetical protein